jgi:transposase
MSKIIGIDVSKQTFDSAILNEEDKIATQKFTNNPKGFASLLKLLQPGDHVVMEASGPYYCKLAHFMYKHNIKVSVVNPLVIKRFCQMRLTRAKTDKKDAVMIARYAVSEKPELWKPDEIINTRLKQINSTMDLYEKQLTMLNNHLEALEQMPIADQEVKRQTKKQIKALQKSIGKLDSEQSGLIETHYSATYTALTSIPGIGRKSAILLIAVTNNFKKFDHYKQLISYLGLSPRIYESGTSVKGKAHICKMGMSRIRKTLYMCSWSAKFFNHFCKQLYERLKLKGKPERVIKIAIVNKLLRQAFAIGKNVSSFNENYQPKLGF